MKKKRREVKSTIIVETLEIVSFSDSRCACLRATDQDTALAIHPEKVFLAGFLPARPGSGSDFFWIGPKPILKSSRANLVSSGGHDARPGRHVWTRPVKQVVSSGSMKIDAAMYAASSRRRRASHDGMRLPLKSSLLTRLRSSLVFLQDPFRVGLTSSHHRLRLAFGF